MADVGPGTALGGYRILSLIGRGGMGVVYLAEHVTLDRRVALKLVAPELHEDEGFRDRFLREARLAASLDHPNIIPVYDAGDEDGVLYLAMRFVEGENLGHVIAREGRLSPERTVEILSKVASALDEAHRNDLVHRDVKPDNVLLGAGERVYLTDFGLVRRLDSASRLTKTGYMMGTLDYMAPEIFRGQEIDGRTDVYSLACVLYECLTGSPPFPRDLQPAVISAHLLEAPPTITASRPELAPGIDEVVAKGMAKEPEERFPTCGDLIETAEAALAATEEARGAPATKLARPPVPPPPPEREGVRGEAPEATRPVAPPEEPDQGRRRRSPWIWAAAVAGVLALGGVAFAASQLIADSGSTGATGPTETGSTGPVRDPEVEVIATVEGTAGWIDVDFGAAWVVSDDGARGLVSRVEPNGELESVEVGRDPVRVTFTGSEDNGSVWTANRGDDTVSRVDVPLSGAGPITFNVGRAPSRILSPSRTPFVWIANADDSTLSRIDIRIDSVSESVRTVTVGPRPVAITTMLAAFIAAVTQDDGTATVVDAPEATITATIPVGNSPSSIHAIGPRLWVANTGDDTLSVVDPETETETEVIEVGSEPVGLINDQAGSVWVRNEGSTSVSRVSLTEFVELSEIGVGGKPVDLTVTPGAVWVAVADGALVRIDLDDEGTRKFEIGCRPASINASPDPETIDPDLRGVWIACEEGAVLHVEAEA